MTDLTEQWKKGELPEGHYYVKDGENIIADYLDGYFYNNAQPMTSFSGGVDEVLAPVPSYEEYLESESHCAVYSDVNKSLKEENQRFKELLKRARDLMNFTKNWACTEATEEMIAKINQEIGEKK